MTQWDLFAIYGIPAALIIGVSFGLNWRELSKEDEVPEVEETDAHSRTIRFLAERAGRVRRR